MTLKRFRKRDLADRFMLVLNVFSLVFLGLSYIAGWVSPNQFWPLAFVGMAFPIILIMVSLFILYWALRKRWFFFMNVAFLLLRWDYVLATVNLSASSAHSEDLIEVITYNVRLFDKYNWSEQQNTSKNIEDFILKEQPDILCIQEFYSRQNAPSKAPNNLLSSPHYKQIHLKNFFAQRENENDFGIATLTSYPILNKGTIVLENSRSALTIFTDILIKSDTIRVYNVHLQSIHLGMDGYQVLDELLENKEIQDVKESKLVLALMKKGFTKRAEQAELIANHISQCPYPIIVCGDFNDVPTSYAYQTIAKGLNDGFSQAGSGFGSTYVRVPFFRIDNILYSDDFKAETYVIHPEEFSDHLAISSKLKKVD